MVRGTAREKGSYFERNIKKFEKLPFAVSLISASTLEVVCVLALTIDTAQLKRNEYLR